MNKDLLYELNDAGNQIEWIQQELMASDSINQPVWIVGHIPISYKDCSIKWALRYNALVERYQHIIRFQTFGHIHTELFSVQRSLKSNKPIGVEFISGNAGTYDKMNPTLRLYQIHEKYHVPIDFSIYRVDIEQSNKNQVLQMERWFDYKREFTLKDLSPSQHLLLS